MTHFRGSTVWLVTDFSVSSMNCASFRAGVITTYLRTSDMLTGITDERFVGAGDWNRPASPGGPRRIALYTSPACSYLGRNNLISGAAT